MVGTISPQRAPVLTVASGDEVVFDTLTLWGGDITRASTAADFLAAAGDHRGRGALGPHTMTGPVAVEGAEPGDVLRVDVLELVPAASGFNMRLPQAVSRGALAAEFDEPELRHYDIDPERLTVEVLPGRHLPVTPFLGVMGILPAGETELSSVPPGAHGGNMDLRHLTVGASLYLPVLRAGAGFYAGDAHAMQGDGEVNQTALECALTRAHVRLTLERGAPLRLPQAANATDVYVLAFDEDLDQAARDAVAEATTLMAQDEGVERNAAYAACSLAVDLAVTQMVNGTCGVHARIPRALVPRFRAGATEIQ